MSFNTSLSGLNAAQADLGVISHDIANVATVGFKESRAEFGDIFATSALGSGSTAIGSGVLLTNVGQQFNQGNLNFTSNSLDMAISGEGFFVTSTGLESSEFSYTRAGQFGVDSSGNVVNANGNVLRVFQTNDDGTVQSTSLDTTIPLQLPSTSGSPQQTTSIDIGVNLQSSATDIDTAATPFNADDPTTFTYSTSATIFDSLGQSHIQSMYFTKTTTPNTWEVHTQIDGQDVNFDDAGTPLAAVSLVFNAQGQLTSTNPAAVGAGASFTTEALGTPGAGVLTNGSEPTQTVTINFGGFDAASITTQFDQNSGVNSLDQDGFAPGQLTGLDISDTGVVRANFSNGQSEALGKIAMARFRNNQGLTQLGSTAWRESINSGGALAGEASTSGFGLIRSGATESSNVDLTKELVNLIVAQRNFQANAKGIEANNALTNTILQIR